MTRRHGQIWGALVRTRFQAGRLGRLLDRLGIREDALVPGCGGRRVGVTIYLAPEENVTLERLAGFIGVTRSQLGRASVVALLDEHCERLQEASSLKYGLERGRQRGM